MRFFYKILFIQILFVHFHFYAQVKHIGLPEIQNFSRNDYQGGTQNWNMDQDADGNLYFANNSGLFQFDGITWTKHLLPNQSSIRSLKIAGSGNIFVGGYNEFGYFKSNEKGKLHYFSISKLIPENQRNLIDFIWKVHLYKDKVIFQSFAKAYIYKDGKLKVLPAPNRFQFSFIVNEKLYFQDVSLGLLEYNETGFIPLSGTKNLNGTEVWGLFSMPNNKILIATLDRGLFIYGNGSITPWETEANVFIKKNSSLGGVAIAGKYIVLNSVLDGIVICDLSGRIVQHINRKKGLQNNTVLSSFVDNRNNLWLGLDNGIAFVNENSPFTYFGLSYDLSTVYASVIFEGNLYVATNQGVFYHSWNSTFKEDTFKLVEGTTGQAWNVQVIDNQLLCSHNRGAMTISGGKSIKTLDGNGYFGFKKIPEHLNFVVGSKYNGFSLFEKKASGWELVGAIKGFDKSASTFELDSENVWLKKDDLVYKLVLSSDFRKFEAIQTYKDLTTKQKGIGSIQSINGKVYFQSQNHFYRFSTEQDLFFEDQKITKLFKNIPIIRSLTQDNYGNLWYIFDESLGVLMKNSFGNYTNSVSQFSNLTGNLVSNYPSINTINPNNIFIGLTDGLAHYDAKLKNGFSSKPKVFIRNFSFPGDTLILGSKQIDKKIKIDYDANKVHFIFSSPSYENLENVEYSYKLDGFDEKWSSWSIVPIKEYTNLKEGDYKMQVKVRNSYGIQSDVSSVNFTISPPWYRHFLAYLLYSIIIVSTIYFGRNQIRVKIRKNKYYETVEQRRLYLEKESKIRQEQYELEKEIEKLKSDKLQIRILAKDKELVSNSLQVVKKNKILNGIIHKLKDIDAESLDESTKFQFTKLNKSIVKEVNADKSWKDLEKHIKNVHFDFLKRLKEKHPTISPRELDLSTYLLMNMSTKEIAEIMNISNGGVELARYRLRKKLGLNKKENLIGFLMAI